MIIISNLIYYLIIHNFAKIFFINENIFRFRIIKAFNAR